MKTDVHTHLIPRVTGSAAVAAGLRVDPDGRLRDGERTIGPNSIYEPEALVSWLDEAGLDRALVSIPPPAYRQGRSPAETDVWIRSLNDGLINTLADTDRLLPLGYLPLDQPVLAVAEAERLARAGIVGYCASAGGGSVPLDDDNLGPLWRFLNDSQLPILLHPGQSPDGRLKAHYLDNLLGNPVETGLAAAQLLLGGVMADHPDLRVCLVHCGGVTFSVLGRWQRGLDTRRPGISREQGDLVGEASQFWVDTLSHDSRVLDLAISAVGVERILIGSDWPFPMGDENPLASVAHLDVETVDKIASRNPKAFLASIGD